MAAVLVPGAEATVERVPALSLEVRVSVFVCCTVCTCVCECICVCVCVIVYICVCMCVCVCVCVCVYYHRFVSTSNFADSLVRSNTLFNSASLSPPRVGTNT
jgi:fatty-acid desaturase